MKSLLEEQGIKLRSIIENEYKVEGELRTELSFNIKRLIDINCYRGTPASGESAGARPAHAHQCAHAQGSEGASGRRQEEGGPGQVGRSTDAYSAGPRVR